MKHAARNLVLVLILTLLFTPALQSAAEKRKPSRKPVADQADTVGSQTSAMPVWQARKAIKQGLARVEPRIDRHVNGWVDEIKINLGSVRIRPDSVEFEAVVSSHDTTEAQGLTSFSIDLTSAGAIEGRRCPGFVNRGLCKSGYSLTVDGRWKYRFLWWSDADDAEAFAGAVNRLRAAARGQGRESLQADWPEFQQKAAAWRALSPKPIISEDVRRRRLLAENAVKENRFDSAIEEYEAGLEINPTWPEGHFNAALLYAELGYYPEAMHHMRAYLELTPDAPDAQQARDQVVIWEAKLR